MISNHSQIKTPAPIAISNFNTNSAFSNLLIGQGIALLFRFFSQGIALRLLHITPKRFTKFIGLAWRAVNYLVGNDAKFFVNAFT
jgi:predicted tellurium resistance membrane protein TerC